MTSRRVCHILLLCLMMPSLRLLGQYPEGISVSPAASNNYVIAPYQTYASISFNVSFSGPYPGMKYRYNYYADGNLLGTYTFPQYPFSVSFSAALSYGQHSISVGLDRQVDAITWYPNVASNSTTVTLNQDFRVIAQNSFDGTAGGGQVYVDGQLVGSGSSNTWRKFTSHSVNDYEDGRMHGGYRQRFTQWTGFSEGPVTAPTVFFPALYDADLTAHHVTQYEVHFGYSGGGGGMIIGGQYYAYPAYATFYVDKGGGISAEALPYSSGGLVYAFSSWSNGSTQANTTFYPTSNTTFSANRTFWKPEPPTSVQAGGSVGQHVRVTWTDNPNTGVTYLIYREPKNQSSVHVATVGNGVGSWTDPLYVVTGSGTDEMLFYHVYGSYGGVLSDQTTAIMCATNNGAGVKEDAVLEGGEIPTSYKLATYPNPFNPSTTISYQVAQDASVRLEIYDMMGRRVKSLVSSNRSAGCYSAVWNGRDDNGKEVSSGVYLYQFIALPLNGGKAFRHSGKLMLTR